MEVSKETYKETDQKTQMKILCDSQLHQSDLLEKIHISYFMSSELEINQYGKLFRK